MPIAIATTVLSPGPEIIPWMDYHFHTVDRIVIYLDDPSERPVLEALCKDRPVTLFDGSQDHPEMTPESRTIQRQQSNIMHATQYLLEAQFSWLLHIDIDELLYIPDEKLRDWSELKDVGSVHFTNHEAIPLKHDTDAPFVDCMRFRINGKGPLMAYGNGKSAVRLSSKVKPHGPHAFIGYKGSLLKPSAENAMLLHYPTPSFERWQAKFKHYGSFSDYWYNDPKTPNRVDFMLRSRDVVQEALNTDDWSKAREFFESWIPSESEQENMIAEGKVRQYTPFAA